MAPKDGRRQDLVKLVGLTTVPDLPPHLTLQSFSPKKKINTSVEQYFSKLLLTYL